MAFKTNGSLNPEGAPVLRRKILANSITVVEMDSVKLASGFVALGTAGAQVFGHVISISSADQVGVLTTGAAGAAIGSFAGSYTTASDNQTVGIVTGVCDVSKDTLYSAEVDATLGTTTGSNLAGYRMDLIDEDTLDESSAVTTAAQYFSWGVDPENSARTIVNIYESQVYGV